MGSALSKSLLVMGGNQPISWHQWCLPQHIQGNASLPTGRMAAAALVLQFLAKETVSSYRHRGNVMILINGILPPPACVSQPKCCVGVILLQGPASMDLEEGELPVSAAHYTWNCSVFKWHPLKLRDTSRKKVLVLFASLSLCLKKILTIMT